jgi:ribosomal protein S27AE
MVDAERFNGAEITPAFCAIRCGDGVALYDLHRARCPECGRDVILARPSARYAPICVIDGLHAGLIAGAGFGFIDHDCGGLFDGE